MARTPSPTRETRALPGPPHRKGIQSMRYLFGWLVIVTATPAYADISATDCARAAKYSESKRGVSMLVIQNGRTIFEHYANGGSARGKWPIFSGTKSFWGIAALAAARDGLFKLDDPVSDTITEWKSDPRKSQITIRELLNQTDGIEGASRLQRASMRDRNAMAIRLSVARRTRIGFYLWPEPSANLFRAVATKTKRARRHQLLRRTCVQPAWTGPAQLQKRRSR